MNVSNFDELYPNRFLKAGLVENNPTYTILDVYLDALEGDEGKVKKKGIIKFADSEFELTLNKTNGLCLREMFGKDLKNWVGKRVTLCSEKTRFGKDTVDAVRVFGSPDIKSDMNVIIQMPKRKPITRVLKATGAPQKSQIDYEFDLANLLEDARLTESYVNQVSEYVKANPEKIRSVIAKVHKKIAELVP